jgi:aminomethyltransferase
LLDEDPMAEPSATPHSAPAVTPLHGRHVALGARMVPFAGYDMPVQYPTGIIAEHQWTREAAGLFDVSHMGQAWLVPADGRFETAAAALEALVPADIAALSVRQQRYTQFTNEAGGTLDDLMVTRMEDGSLYLVVNAGCKEADYAHLAAHLPSNVALKRRDDLALLALQGPQAMAVLASHDPALAEMAFMTSRDAVIGGIAVQVSRSGYTGEDGAEISVAGAQAVALWDLLLADARVKPIGLGARDSLRLEAGLSLYGHELTPDISPVEAGLAWSIQKRRRLEGGFPGAQRLQRELTQGPVRFRVGLRLVGRAPAREGSEIVTPEGEAVGIVTSGGFGPSVGGPIALGLVTSAHSAVGTRLHLMVRGKPLEADVVPLPFVQHRFHRRPA